jgi:hypothetical protein
VIGCCAAVMLVVGSLGVFKTQETKQVVEKGAKDLLLSKKEVKKAKAVIAAAFDSIRHQEVKNKIVAVQRDSAVVAARHHEAKADSAIKVLTHEILTDADATPSRVFDRLASYKPSKYAVGESDSIY